MCTGQLRLGRSGPRARLAPFSRWSWCVAQLYILGICGTFMGGLALLARERRLAVAGCDAGVYPPMSTSSRPRASPCDEGWDPAPAR
jgi:UDP-N-acetylmuramate-alanine ligase